MVNAGSPSDDKLTSMAKGMLIGLTLFFFLASLGQLVYLHTEVADSPTLDLTELFQQRIGPNPADAALLSLMELEARMVLEEHALKRRYHQGNALLMSRIWISYLSFVTGMILSLVGASFILGRIRESVTKLDTDSKFAKISIASSSPGIILATLGVVLIMTSILTNHRIAVEDASVYLPGYGTSSAMRNPLPREHEERVQFDDPNLKALNEALE